MQNISAILNLINSWNKNSLVVLDIDSTLVLTHLRNQAILKDFAKENLRKYPEHSKILLQAQCNPMEYGYEQSLLRLKLDQAPESFIKELKAYWRKHFFSNAYLKHDTLHEGAVEFVNYLEQKNIPYNFLTGRYHTTMWDGTLEYLQKMGFPIHKDILHLKPLPEHIDEEYKSEKISEFKKQFKKITLIDNEPKVLNQIAQDHPDVTLVFVDTCHSPNVKAPESAYQIKDFSFFMD